MWLVLLECLRLYSLEQLLLRRDHDWLLRLHHVGVDRHEQILLRLLELLLLGLGLHRHVLLQRHWLAHLVHVVALRWLLHWLEVAHGHLSWLLAGLGFQLSLQLI